MPIILMQTGITFKKIANKFICKLFTKHHVELPRAPSSKYTPKNYHQRYQKARNQNESHLSGCKLQRRCEM